MSPCADIAADGFVSFEFSQYFPFEHLVAVDRQTSFIPYFTDAPLRRSGRMTERQKRQRQQLERRLGRPDPRAVEKGMRELLTVSLEGASTAVVCTDEHRAYRRAMRDLPVEITHRRTSSRDVRDRHNELFEINALDMFLRHSSANHRRETIAFSRRRQRSAERLAVFVVWKNFVKRRWEKRCRQTPGMLQGLVERVWGVAEVLRERFFPRLVDVPARWRDYYWGRVVTPVLGVNRRHELRYAF
jgi:IS1 family transposase